MPTALAYTKGCVKYDIVYRIQPNIHKSDLPVTLYLR